MGDKVITILLTGSETMDILMGDKVITILLTGGGTMDILMGDNVNTISIIARDLRHILWLVKQKDTFYS
jgi:hypothetical protein